MLPEKFSPTAFCMFGDNKAFVYNDNIRINMSHQKISCISNIYIAVPVRILTSEFLFHT